MKQEFEMTEAELQAIYDISRNIEPVIFVGIWTGLDRQERANKLWQTMGDHYEFEWESVEPSAKGKRFFLATPKPKIIPKTETEKLMDEFNTLQKIVDQLEWCKYEAIGGPLETNIAFMKLKELAIKEIQ